MMVIARWRRLFAGRPFTFKPGSRGAELAAYADTSPLPGIT
jgi:hypothetical protein